MDELADTLSRLRAAWMGGSDARRHCPPGWLALAGDGAQAELALAALAGQALQAVFRPAAPGPLVAREALPALALPPVPDALRPRVRRLMSAHPGLVRPLLLFLEARGVTAHPFDWLPGRRAEALPAIYAPWAAWVDGGPARPGKAHGPRQADTAEAAAELAAMLELRATGLLRRRRRLVFPRLGTAPAKARRLALFSRTSLPELAAALGVAAPELVQLAPAGDEAGIAAFVAMVAATGTAGEQAQLLAAMVEDEGCPLGAARLLAGALDRPGAAGLLARIMRREASPGFGQAVELAGAALGLATLGQIAASPGYEPWRQLLVAAGAERQAGAGTGTGAGAGAGAGLAAGLAALGLLAGPQAAASLVGTALEAGLRPMDPWLDALHLNIALDPETAA